MSTIKCDNLQNTAGTKTIPVNTVVDGSAKAWVNFNGTGTVAIRAAFNVSSIIDNGVGSYTVNFTTAMPDASYAAVVTGSNDAQANFPAVAAIGHTTTSVILIFANNLSTGSVDQTTASAVVFR